MPRITDFCIYIYVFGCRSSLFRLCDSDFGITPVDDITIRITCAAFCFHIAHISFASSWYLFCLLVIVLVRLCVFGTAMSIKKVVFVFLSMRVMSGRSEGTVLSVIMLQFQYSLKLSFSSTLAGVLIVWAYVFNHFSCFCQFLVDNFSYSFMSLYTLGMCQLLTCCSSVLDRLRSFSTSSAQLIGVWLLQNIFLIVSG